MFRILWWWEGSASPTAPGCKFENSLIYRFEFTQDLISHQFTSKRTKDAKFKPTHLPITDFGT